MVPEVPQNVREALSSCLPENQSVLKATRALIFEVAKENAEIGTLTETLKWGQPAYLTEQTKSGSTLRLGQLRSDMTPAIFVNCRTSLVEQYKDRYGDMFNYHGTRALLLNEASTANTEALKHCIALVLTYHIRK